MTRRSVSFLSLFQSKKLPIWVAKKTSVAQMGILFFDIPAYGETKKRQLEIFEPVERDNKDLFVKEIGNTIKIRTSTKKI